MKREKNKEGNVTVQKEIVVHVIRLLAISMAILVVFSAYLNYSGASRILKQAMTETVQLAAERVEQQLRAASNVASELGAMEMLSDGSVDLESKKAIIAQRISNYGYSRGDILDASGVLRR